MMFDVTQGLSHEDRHLALGAATGVSPRGYPAAQ